MDEELLAMGTEETERDEATTEYWRHFLTTGEAHLERDRRIFHLLPGTPRCRLCNAPFRGAGAPVAKLVYGKKPSNINPRYCSTCEDFAKQNQGGAEVEMAMLFADVRGSTRLAESMGPGQFSRLINRFYQASTEVMIRSDAMIDKLIGDEVVGIYVPGFAGQDYARRAIKAAMELLKATGHADADGPWVPVGAGVHSGEAFVGAVGTKEGVTDITALGDVPNTASRLASQAGIGEVLVSEETCRRAGLEYQGLEKRRLDLKGRSEAVDVRVLRTGTDNL